MNADAMMEIIEKALGMSDAEVTVASLRGGTNASTRFADNVITQSEHKTEYQLSVECAYGQKHGAAATSNLSEEAIKSVVQRAEAAAKASPPDPEYMPPVGKDESGKYAKVEAYDARTAQTEPRERAQAVRKAVDRAIAGKMRISGLLATNDEFQALANSAGLRAFHPSTTAYTHVTALGDNGSGWAHQCSHRIGDIDLQATAERSLGIARQAQNPTDIEPGRYTVILRPAAVQEFVPYYVICDAKATDEGRTCLRGKLGQKVCGENITLRSNPADPRCPRAPFRHDGLASPTLNWIGKGVLENLATSRFWAKKTGRRATGYPANVIMDGGTATDEEMIASTERGIFVVRFWYIRYVDPMESLLTGMTRDGLFLIENGKITRPLKQWRFNDTVLGVLSRVEQIGQLERVENMLMPTIKVRDFHFTSTTKF
jgi:predicted Zn-dependent protease